MPPLKTRSRRKIESSTSLRDLFRDYPIPPSLLHQTVQDAARREGWVPPWEREEQIRKKKMAGKSSGRSRRSLAQLRQSLLKLARMRLSPDDRRAPYSKTAIAALRREYNNLLSKNANDPDPLISGMLSALSPTEHMVLKKASDDTLLKDLKDIRRMSGVRR